MIQYGIDNVERYAKILQNKCLGVISNPSGVNVHLRTTVSILVERFNVTALYGPEHGVSGNYLAGEKFDNARHPIYGITEYALYGKGNRLDAERLQSVDMIIFDVQDIGSRFYTYIHTLSDAMKDCAAAGIPLVVLDRPNPLGGTKCEGTMLRSEYSSFVGRFPLPFRHCFTVGEYALYVNDRFGINCDLTVIPCSGWSRNMGFWEYSSTTWLNPSPNMPSVDCALTFNGNCIFEGSNVSEGRGTTRPYETVCAPFIDPEKIATRLNALKLPGVIYRPFRTTPFATRYKYPGILCGAIQTHIVDRNVINGFECGMRLFEAIRDEHPELDFTSPGHVDRIFGDNVLRTDSESIDSIIERGREESREFFDKIASDYFLYR